MIRRVAAGLLWPRFVYEFRTSLPGKAYLKHVEGKASAYGLEILDRGHAHIAFRVGASELLGRPAVGTHEISIFQEPDSGYRISVTLLAHRNAFRIVAGALSLLAALSAALSGDPARLIAIPIIVLSGHLVFWGVLPSKISPIKGCLLEMDVVERAR